MNEIKEIKASLLELLQNGLQNSFEVNFLAKYCLKISKAYLQTKYFYLKKPNFNDYYNLDEIALDSIVSLFQKNNIDNDIVIIRSFKNWRTKIETKSHADYFLHNIVWNRVEQQLTRIYKENDPFFNKILNSVKYKIKTSGHKTKSYFGTCLIINQNNDCTNAKIIDSENFNSIPLDVFYTDKELDLAKILIYIEEETEFFAAIPLNLLIKRLKFIRSHDFVMNEEENIYTAFENNNSVSEIISASKEKLFNKIDSAYYQKGKFSKIECDIFKQLMHDIADDLSNGGMNKGLFDYYKEKEPSISSEVFYKNYHTTLCYLIKALKNNIAENLERAD